MNWLYPLPLSESAKADSFIMMAEQEGRAGFHTPPESNLKLPSFAEITMHYSSVLQVFEVCANRNYHLIEIFKEMNKNIIINEREASVQKRFQKKQKLWLPFVSNTTLKMHTSIINPPSPLTVIYRGLVDQCLNYFFHRRSIINFDVIILCLSRTFRNSFVVPWRLMSFLLPILAYLVYSPLLDYRLLL